MIDTASHRRRRSACSGYRGPRLLFGLVTAALPMAGCQQADTRLQVWVQDDVYGGPTLTGATDSPAHYEARTDRVTLAGAINETLSFCLVLSIPTVGLDNLSVTPGDLGSGEASIPANAIRLYRVHEVTVDRWPGWHVRGVPPHDRLDRVPDVLVPIDAPKGGLAERLEGVEPVRLWVDVHIPKGTAPATYFGRIELRSGDKLLESVHLSLTVWPFVLPEPTGVTLLTEVDHQRLFADHLMADTPQGGPRAPLRQWADAPAGAELDDLLTTTVRLLRSHKVTPLLPRLTPLAKVEATGRLSVDWEDSDRVVSGFLDGRRFFDRQPLRLWCIPFNEEFPPPPAYGAMSSPTYSRLAREYLADCAAHFADRGWLKRSSVFLPHVKEPGPESYAAVRHFGRLVQAADRRLQRLAALFPQDMSAFGWQGFAWEDVSRQVDIWAPPAQFFDPAEMQQQRMRQRRTFWSLDRPPFSGSIALAARPADTRVIAWQARAYDAEAVILGSANPPPAEPESARPPSPQDCWAGGTAPLIYPGRFFGLSSPVPSARLKRLRRSMQDLAYLELLEQRGLTHIASVLTESLAPRAAADACGAHFADGRSGGWSNDLRHWRVARRIMADEIMRSVRRGQGAEEPGSPLGGVTSSVPAGVADTVRWRRFVEAARRVQIAVDGVRVRPVGPTLAGVVEVTVGVRLVNHTRRPISATLAFERLPIAWQAQTPEVRVPEIGPRQSRRLTLRATAGVMETDAGGVCYLPMILRTSDGEACRFSARLAYLAATPIHRPLEIDGDLSDWPSAVGNAAEDFLLITGEDPETPGLPSARATQATQCFAAADGEALYFAFNGLIGGTEALPRGQRNYVRYEDGVPIGEELIEILIDPTNAGTRSTSDLFHVVLKPNGWFCERGIGTVPPTGVCRPWAAGLAAAVQIHNERWVAEVRIPLQAFDVRTEGRQIWGLNLTRFDLARQEFSNWSGAARNAYDPLSLGNLALP